MEGKYTKIGVLIAIASLILTIIQFFPTEDKKIDGEWKMTSKITDADLKKYIGIEIQWKLYLTEIDQKVKGTAEKIAIDNKELDYNLRTTIDIEGNIKNNILTLNYTEYGIKRKTTGIFFININDNVFNGHFSQTASNTKGVLIGFKVKN